MYTKRAATSPVSRQSSLIAKKWQVRLITRAACECIYIVHHVWRTPTLSCRFHPALFASAHCCHLRFRPHLSFQGFRCIRPFAKYGSHLSELSRLNCDSLYRAAGCRPLGLQRRKTMSISLKPPGQHCLSAFCRLCLFPIVYDGSHRSRGVNVSGLSLLTIKYGVLLPIIFLDVCSTLTSTSTSSLQNVVDLCYTSSWNLTDFCNRLLVFLCRLSSRAGAV